MKLLAGGPALVCSFFLLKSTLEVLALHTCLT